MTDKRAVLGIMPKKLWVETRALEVMRAMLRYDDDRDAIIPKEMWQELGEHLLTLGYVPDTRYVHD